MSYKEISKNETKTQQIGNFTSLSVGSGATIFKATNGWLWGGAANASSSAFRVNLQTGALYASNATISGAITATSGSFTGAVYATSGTFSGSINASSGTFRGTIYAEDGAIEGDLDIDGNLTVNGSLLTDNGSGYQVKMSAGKLSVLKSGAEKGFIRTPSGSAGLQISTNENLYITKITGATIAEFKQDSSLHFSTDSYIRWASGRSINATSSTLEIDGDLVPNSNYGVDCGSSAKKWHNVRAQYVLADTYFSCAGDGGQGFTHELVTSIYWDSNSLKARAREYTFKGGICTAKGSERTFTVHSF